MKKKESSLFEWLYRMNIFPIFILNLVEGSCKAKPSQMLQKCCVSLVLSKTLNYHLYFFSMLALSFRQLSESQSFVFYSWLSSASIGKLSLNHKLLGELLACYSNLSPFRNILDLAFEFMILWDFIYLHKAEASRKPLINIVPDFVRKQK